MTDTRTVMEKVQQDRDDAEATRLAARKASKRYYTTDIPHVEANKVAALIAEHRACTIRDYADKFIGYLEEATDGDD